MTSQAVADQEAGPQWADEVRRLAARARRGDPGAQLPAPGDPGRRRPRRRLARAGPARGGQPGPGDRARRGVLHGRDGQDPRAGADRADPGPASRLLARRQHHRRPAPGLEGRAPGRRGGRLREHQRRGQGRVRRVLHVGQRGADRGRACPPTARCCSCPTSSSARMSAGSPAGTTCMSGWASATCTPASARTTCAARRPRRPDAELFIHPECGCSTGALWQAGAGDLPARPDPGAVHRRDAGRGPHDHARRPCWSPPRPACCTSCARPTRRCAGSRSTRTRSAST